MKKLIVYVLLISSVIFAGEIKNNKAEFCGQLYDVVYGIKKQQLRGVPLDTFLKLSKYKELKDMVINIYLSDKTPKELATDALRFCLQKLK